VDRVVLGLDLAMEVQWEPDLDLGWDMAIPVFFD
jgi:hypothetical protein